MPFKPGDWVQVQPSHDLPPGLRGGEPTRGRVAAVTADHIEVLIGGALGAALDHTIFDEMRETVGRHDEAIEQLTRRVAKLEEPGGDIDRTGQHRGYGTGDHLIPVDLAAVLADPSLAKLDANGPALVFLKRLATAAGAYESGPAPQVIVRTAR